ncbi:hypothetical protein J7E49_24040 [Variovorax paradoxus]|nr:hypothetical protein [Variovorax paradoxus]
MPKWADRGSGRNARDRAAWRLGGLEVRAPVAVHRLEQQLGPRQARAAVIEDAMVDLGPHRAEVAVARVLLVTTPRPRVPAIG